MSPTVPPSGSSPTSPSSDPADAEKAAKLKSKNDFDKHRTSGPGSTPWDNFLSMCTPEQKKKIKNNFCMAISKQIDRDQKRMLAELRRERKKIENPDAPDDPE